MYEISFQISTQTLICATVAGAILVGLWSFFTTPVLQVKVFFYDENGNKVIGKFTLVTPKNTKIVRMAWIGKLLYQNGFRNVCIEAIQVKSTIGFRKLSKKKNRFRYRKQKNKTKKEAMHSRRASN